MQKLDVENLNRKKTYDWFKNFRDSTYGVNLNIDVTSLVKLSKETNTSFFINFLFILVKSLNNVDEMKMRFLNNEAVIYDVCNPGITVLTKNNTFEKELYKELRNNNIEATSHYKIGKYEIDFVVNDENGKKIAIECDGDETKSKEEYETDITEQDVLTRCGWKFIRLRASQFYSNKEKTISELVTRINNILSEEDNFNIVEPVFKLKDFDENIEDSKEKEDIKEDNKDGDKSNIEDKISEITKNINLTNIYVNDSDKE